MKRCIVFLLIVMMTISCSLAFSEQAQTISFDADEYYVAVGKSITIKPIITIKKSKNLEWSSSNEEVAIVNGKGIIRGISLGESIITADDKEGNKATCIVSVISPVKKVVFNEEKTFSLPVGMPYALKATIEPEDASIKDITWASSNEKVATVDEQGIVTGISKGNVKITALAVDGSKAKATVTIRFEEYDMIFTDRAPQTAKYFYGSGRYTVKGKVKTGNVSIPDITTTMWASVIGGYGSNEFEVTPEKAGTDVITVKAGRVKTTISVYVSPDAFGTPKIQNLGFGEGAIVGAGREGIFNGHSYKIFMGRYTWNDAKEMCEREGGHLVTITDEYEQQFVEMLNKNDKALWIGYERDELLDSWHWVTGEESDYDNWGFGEPNNSLGREKTAGTRPDTWNDFNGDDAYSVDGYMCEWDTIIY